MTASTNAAAVPDDTALKERILRNELAIILGCQDGYDSHKKADMVMRWVAGHGQCLFAQPAAAPLSGWISVDAALPEHDQEGAAYVWAAWNGAAGFALGPRTGEARYIKTLGWQPMGTQGWDWSVSHWMLMPKYPGTEAAPVAQDAALTGAKFAAAQHLHTVQVQAEALTALQAKCALLSASLKQVDGVRDGLVAALREIANNAPSNQASVGVIARAALIAAGELP